MQAIFNFRLTLITRYFCCNIVSDLLWLKSVWYSAVVLWTQLLAHCIFFWNDAGWMYLACCLIIEKVYHKVLDGKLHFCLNTKLPLRGGGCWTTFRFWDKHFSESNFKKLHFTQHMKCQTYFKVMHKNSIWDWVVFHLLILPAGVVVCGKFWWKNVTWQLCKDEYEFWGDREESNEGCW